MILTALLVMTWMGMSAQSPAAQVKEIQKNPATYISAESTDPSEDEAYSNAMRQMIDMARNFVSTNNNGANISDKAIEAAVKKIVIPRGDFKRVFVYAKRDDLLEKSGNDVAIPDEQPKPVIEDPAKQPEIEGAVETETQPAQPTKPVKEPETVGKPKGNEGTDSDEEFEEEVPKDIVEEVSRTANVSGATKEIIGRLQQAKSLNEATDILNRYMGRRMVSNFGVARQAHNSAACYWVVEDDGQITVLGPEVRGHRNNFRTGKTDALHRYTKGLWFRKR